MAPTDPRPPAPAPPSSTRKVMPLDRTHVMDWAVLDLGHQPVSRTDVSLVDLDVQVFGLREIEGVKRDVAVILLTHGWANKARDMHPMASGLIGEFARLDAEGTRKRVRDVLVVTLDQRNHGARRRIKDTTSWPTAPREYAKYMARAVTGGVQDLTLVMDFLPGVLFPKDERRVVEFMAGGFSMGGHVIYRILRTDPRIRTLVPFCSIPSENLRLRLLSSPLPPGTAETPLPADVSEWYLRPVPAGMYDGKRILAIHGGHDNIMPWTLCAQRWEEIKDLAEATERYVDEDVGHLVSPEMVRRAAGWFWYWGLTE